MEKEKATDMRNKDIISLDFDSLVNRIQNTSVILQQDARLVKMPQGQVSDI